MAKIKGMSLFMKTGLLAFCLFGVISILTSALAAYTLYDRLSSEYTSKGTAIATAIAGASQEILLGRDAAKIQSMIDQYLEIEGVAYVFVIDAEGVIVAHTFVPEVPGVLKYLPRSKHRQIVTEMEIESFGKVIDICVPVLAGVAGFVHVGMDKGVIINYFWKAILDMQVLLFFIFWACVGLLYLFTRHISRPLHQLTEYARRLAAHDFGATIDIRTKDELNVLGRAMQSMGQELSLLFSEMETEVEKATDELRDHMAYLSSIIDNLADGLLVVSTAGRITVINPAMREFFGLGNEDYRGRPVAEVLPPTVQEMTSRVRTCTHEVVSAELPLSTGRVGKAIGSSVMAEDPAPQCLGGVILVRDITREKELDQLKTDFISTVSHELRTPMTSVLGFSKIIRKKLEQTIFPPLAQHDPVSKAISQVRGNMDIIVTEAERLTELINDVLDIARMEAGKALWRNSNVSMAEVVRQSRNATKGLWGAKGLDVELDVEDDLPFVYGDYDRLVQVVVNLLSNAIKFSVESPIICRARKDGSFVEVSVTDRGAGIGEDDVSTVFDKFKQVGDTLTAKPTGTGLGLPICRQIVEHHGGQIWVESRKGTGSVFSFIIPVAENTISDLGDTKGECVGCPFDLGAEPDGGVHGHAGNRPLILIVDDDPSLVRFLREVFEENGFAVSSALSGEEAVRLADKLSPDLITMDIMMPFMDGRETIKILRSASSTWHIPVLVITALSGEQGAVGDMSLIKPVDEAQVVEAARALLGGRSECKSCLVLGERQSCDLDGLAALCLGDIVFCSEEKFWQERSETFRGTVFIPAEEYRDVDLERLTGLSGVSVVILPRYSCR